MRLLPSILFCGIVTAVSCGAPEPVKVATDPEKAGPDYAIQGEYVGEASGKKLGAEVIARGDGKFEVNLLPGGLRGEGGDYAKRQTGTAATEGDKVKVTAKTGKWAAEIAAGKLTGKLDDGQPFTLARVVRQSKTLGMKPPQGAVVLFDGTPETTAKMWGKNTKTADGNLLGNDLACVPAFKDHKLHLEFRLSYMPFASGQGRSNSGVYAQHRYEIQVLDSFGLRGANNECGGIYSNAEPLVNMCYPPLTWQTYDIEFKTARFKDGKKVADAVVSVYHNGVLIHDKLELKKGPTGGGKPESAEGGPLFLQGHGGQVQYRNIWVQELAP